MNGSAPETLIVADDHPLFRDALRLAVSSVVSAARIGEAGSFEELTAMLEREGDVDLVLLDLQMPPPNGIEVLEQLRAGGIDTPMSVPAGLRSLKERFSSGESAAIPAYADEVGGDPLGIVGTVRDDDDLAWEPGEAFAPLGGDVDRDHVLDPDAGLLREVDPRLDAEDRRRRQRLVAGRSGEAGGLVGLQADAVAEREARGAQCRRCNRIEACRCYPADGGHDILIEPVSKHGGTQCLPPETRPESRQDFEHIAVVQPSE